MFTEQDQKTLEAKLQEKTAEEAKLMQEHEQLLLEITSISQKKNSILDLISALEQKNGNKTVAMSKETEMDRLGKLEQSSEKDTLLKLLNGEIDIKDVEVDPVLLYLMHSSNSL